MSYSCFHTEDFFVGLSIICGLCISTVATGIGTDAPCINTVATGILVLLLQVLVLLLQVLVLLLQLLVLLLQVLVVLLQVLPTRAEKDKAATKNGSGGGPSQCSQVSGFPL